MARRSELAARRAIARPSDDFVWGPDFSVGAGFLSAPERRSWDDAPTFLLTAPSEETINNAAAAATAAVAAATAASTAAAATPKAATATAAAGSEPMRPPGPWVRVARRLQRHVLPRLPRDALLAVAGAAGAELIKREASGRVADLPEPLRPQALALLNQTFEHVTLRVGELQAGGWNWKAAALREAAAWRRRHDQDDAASSSSSADGAVYAQWEALVRLALQGRADEIVKEWSGGAVSISGSGAIVGAVGIEQALEQIHPAAAPLVRLTAETRAQLKRIEVLVKQLDAPGGLGEVGVVELYSVLSGGAAAPAAVMDVARLLSISNTTAYSLASLEAAGDAQITLASLLVRLTSPVDITRALVYSALAAENEAVESLRALSESLQDQVARTLAEMEDELLQANAASAVAAGDSSSEERLAPYNYAAALAGSAVRAARDAFSEGMRQVNSGFEELVEPSRRGLPRPGQLLPWQQWCASMAWTPSVHDGSGGGGGGGSGGGDTSAGGGGSGRSSMAGGNSGGGGGGVRRTSARGSGVT